MALTTGLLVDCDDKNVTGGIKKFWLASCSEWEGGTFTVVSEDYTVITKATKVFYLFDTEENKTSFTSSTEGMGKGTLYTYEFKAFIPGTQTASLAVVRDIQDEGHVLLITEDWDGNKFFFGHDQQFFLKASGKMSSVVHSTGENISDTEVAGVEITLTFVHKELARLFTGTVSV